MQTIDIKVKVKRDGQTLKTPIKIYVEKEVQLIKEVGFYNFNTLRVWVISDKKDKL